MVAGICKNSSAITEEASVVQVLDEATSTYALSSVFNSLKHFVVEALGSAVPIPCRHASCQDALRFAPVEHPRHLGPHGKHLQLL